MTNVIDLPKIGDKIETNAGQVCGPTLGTKLWKKPLSEFLDHRDLQMDWDFMDDEIEYRKLDVIVADCKINKIESYKNNIWDYNRETDTETLKGSYKIYYDKIAFCYVLLCRFGNEYLMIEEWGYDPKYELKYHYDKFGLANYYVVE